MIAQDDMLDWYQRELAYLRTQSADFAGRYPKVAQRLALSGAESPDPHTERLIEAVAFLTARVHRDLDREFPAVAGALLENVCPNLAQPVPACTVVQMRLDPSQGKVTSGLRVAAGTGLAATADTGATCRFRTAWDLVLWPLQVVAVQLEDTRALRLDLACEPGVDVAELELDRLRLHLGGDLLLTMPLHELLVTSLQGIEVLAGGGAVHRLGPDTLKEVGYAEGEEVLPRAPHAQPALGLLQEYFAFPRKFHFFDVTGLRGRLGRGEGFSLRLVFDRSAPVLSRVTPDHLLLGCAPAANLFTRGSEPIRLDRRRHEYLLLADAPRDAFTEVHSVLSVTASDPGADRPLRIPCVFTEPDLQASESADLFWTMRREISSRPGIAGTDVFLGFVDRADVRAIPGEPVVYAQLLCTNRRLAAQLPPGARFVGEGVPVTTRIRALYPPSAPRDPALGSQALWALVGMLRLNHRSLVEGDEALQALQRMLMLFAGESGREQAQVRGIVGLQAHPATVRIGRDGWRGWCRGTDVALRLDPEAFIGGSPLLLAGVLARVFALHTTANSFARLSVQRGEDTWKQWPAMGGRQCLI